MNTKQYIKLIASFFILALFSGCSFYDEADFKEKEVLNCNGGANINGEVINWIGTVTFTNNGGSYVIYSGSDKTPSSFTATITGTLGVSGTLAPENVNLVFKYKGVNYSFQNNFGTLTFDTLGTTVTVKGNIQGRDSDTKWAVISPLDAEVIIQ